MGSIKEVQCDKLNSSGTHPRRVTRKDVPMDGTVRPLNLDLTGVVAGGKHSGFNPLPNPPNVVSVGRTFLASSANRFSPKRRTMGVLLPIVCGSFRSARWSSNPPSSLLFLKPARGGILT